MATGGDAGQVAELAEQHQQRGAGHEAGHDRCRDEARQPAQAQQAHDELDRADQEGERHHPRDQVAGLGEGASVLATTTARALVGPVVMSVELPNRLATIVETMAV